MAKTENLNRMATMDAIGYSEWGYKNFIHQYFVTWCEVMADKFYYQGRELITNEKLWNYYQRQWQVLVENQFVRDYSTYLDKNLQDAHRTYYSLLIGYANDLENYYPASILKDNNPKKKTLQPEPKLNFEFNYN